MKSKFNLKMKKQSGFSLMELMIAMTIGLFMSLGMFSVFVNMKTTYLSQDALTQMYDNQRMLLTLVTNTVQSSGYYLAPHLNTPTSVFGTATATWADASTTSLPAGQALVGKGDLTGSDKIAMRFQTASGDGLMNCQGGTNSSGSNLIYINVIELNANGEITCAVNGGAAQPIMGGVASINIRYGVDINGSMGTGSVDTYLPASAIQGSGLWGAVQTVQFNIVFRNPIDAASNMPNTLTQTVSVMSRL